LKISIDNWRWANVPFYIRTGKYLPKKQSSIVIQFKKAPFMLFRDTPIEKLPTKPHRHTHSADEGITFAFRRENSGSYCQYGRGRYGF
jgi:glucose-6-phosphate 1-dehydrogenase